MHRSTYRLIDLVYWSIQMGMKAQYINVRADFPFTDYYTVLCCAFFLGILVYLHDSLYRPQKVLAVYCR